MTRIAWSFTAVALAAAIAFAAANSVGTATASSSVHTIRLGAKQVATKFVDNKPDGESPGDTISFTDILRRHGRVVGFAEATGTLVDARRDANALQGTFHLPGGEIMIQGLSLGQRPIQTFAIVGGTGRYAGTGGTADIRTTGRATTVTLRPRD